MARWTIACLWLSSLAFFQACKPAGQVVANASPTACNALQQRISTATYNTVIDFKKKHLTGLLVFKQTNDTTTRMVFITETGFKFFDLQFTPQTFKVVYCLPSLNKKIVLNTLEKHFAPIVRPLHLLKSPLLACQNETILTYKVAVARNKYEYYSVDTGCVQLSRVSSRLKAKKSRYIAINGLKNGNFDSIRIANQGLGLYISLNQIER